MTGTPKRNFDWNPENVQTLRELWEGSSAEAIANQLKGVSRNGVIGKAHRLGLEPKKRLNPPKASSIVRARKPKLNFVRPLLSSIPAPVIPVEIKPPTGALVPFLKINHRTCRSVEDHEMVGFHRMALYCPGTKEPEESFCPYHQSIYYRRDTR